MEIFDVDVLVIGAGGAGLRAAIEAKKTGTEPIVVCKGGFPSGCTQHAMGAIQAAYDPGDSTDNHLKDTVIGGCFLNDQNLVKTMVDQSVRAVQDLEKFGTLFQKQDGKYKLITFGGYSYPRAVVSYEPYAGGFIKGLINEVRKLEIEVMERIMITRLLTNNGAVVGAMGLNVKTGDLVTFKAKSTILATGGAGHLYSLTTNPEDVTGDGYFMAYMAGAELMDMEFIQSRACIIHPPTLRGMPTPADGLVSIGGRFYNGLGERYMKKYDPVKIEKVTRDLIAIFAYKEIKEGRGTPHGGIYNDLSGVSEDELKRFHSFLARCKNAGIDPSWQPIEWAPGVHHFMGGVRINEKAETTVPGLFACGEVTAGVHGANRVAANALTDTQVFGAIAGRSAAEKALVKTSPKICMKDVESERERIFRIYEREEGEDAKAIRALVQGIMSNYVGVIRREDELRKALNELERLSKRAQRIYIPDEKNYEELGKTIETLNLINVGKMVTKAALMRTESRGAHYREDFPQRDDKNWLKNITIRFYNGEMLLKTRPVNLVYVKLARQLQN